ncbi:hypothetical protein [Spirulina subsalsa]|uniref:hypothetical protein n=1 Tax=Spirulina subsalsa TaxID=54311 RepID=UPI000307728A|nr:hypothetical protein [Spirulina subsalsa]
MSSLVEKANPGQFGGETRVVPPKPHGFVEDPPHLSEECCSSRFLPWLINGSLTLD